MPRRATRRATPTPIAATTGTMRFTVPPVEIERVEPVEPPKNLWALSRHNGKIVLAVNGGGAMLYLTAREAVKLASHLLANAEGIMQDEELRFPKSGTV